MKINQMIKSALFAALTAISAYLIIPIGPVPITLQTLFVLLSGKLLGKKYGVLAQITYLLLGAFGLPIFSGGRGGLGVLLGPTGGFLISFIPAAWIAAHSFADKKKNFLILIAAVLSNYIIGSFYFSFITSTPLIAAFTMTVLPFIPGDLFKIIVVLILAPVIKKRIN
ncbi:biotin transporter BioY [Halanaerobium congolense]|uniref:Biotin transporter n=1 Tax=Halanaerobium congolense TaxID=54121 RepID=A0A1G6LM77_9FIRM|nr:biotin transporter BioY [Halanaerobium congolense]PTX15648.1 biotin transport system substrate-specific component [Halanaerobium congolense]PXV68724.1 biotin transport system substrate-specific component [Halanaerobium congolense]TDP09410.1 biotin transport system substrate-specific component [Halanaerobium congolense]TDS29158.1 biotin transport system substrate-specific component [Halanaerobium congolense]TDX42459.1 biotin transport system substrate-specific component [Halanaerobium congol